MFTILSTNVVDVQCVIYSGPDTAYTGKEICFGSNEDTLTIVDVTDKTAPVLISVTGYDAAQYTHQGWLSEDMAYFMYNDELDEVETNVNTNTYVMDVSSLSDPVFKGSHVGRTKSIDHNNVSQLLLTNSLACFVSSSLFPILHVPTTPSFWKYVVGDYLYQANYQSGLNILKMKDLSTATFVEKGYFDIYPEADDNEFNAMWSNYPFFPSGTIVASGVEQGFFALKFTKAPGASETCAGSDSTAFLLLEGETYTCDSITTDMCSKKKVKEFCPNACGKCKFECEDAGAEFTVKETGGATWTCNRLANLTPEKILKKCMKEGFATTCREVCDYCS